MKNKNNLKYRWISDWIKLDNSVGWAHHGLAVTNDGEVIAGHPTEPKICFITPQGEIYRELLLPVTETHGLTIVEENGQEYLWIADIGKKKNHNDGFQSDLTGEAQILKIDLNGNILVKMKKGNFPGYSNDDAFVPTAVSVDSTTGDIWIADGYGSSKVHKFSKELSHLLTLTGETGSGRFNCPHWIYVDHRSDTTFIYVSDRGNDRIQKFTIDGEYADTVADGETIKPSGFCSFQDYLVVAELTARVLILDGNDSLIKVIGDGRDYTERSGWPNRLDETSSPIAPTDLETGKFNSPHGIACDASGNIYVSEWLIGDRFTKLERL